MFRSSAIKQAHSLLDVAQSHLKLLQELITRTEAHRQQIQTLAASRRLIELPFYKQLNIFSASVLEQKEVLSKRMEGVFLQATRSLRRVLKLGLVSPEELEKVREDFENDYHLVLAEEGQFKLLGLLNKNRKPTQLEEDLKEEFQYLVVLIFRHHNSLLLEIPQSLDQNKKDIQGIIDGIESQQHELKKLARLSDTKITELNNNFQALVANLFSQLTKYLKQYNKEVRQDVHGHLNQIQLDLRQYVNSENKKFLEENDFLEREYQKNYQNLSQRKVKVLQAAKQLMMQSNLNHKALLEVSVEMNAIVKDAESLAKGYQDKKKELQGHLQFLLDHSSNYFKKHDTKMDQLLIALEKMEQELVKFNDVYSEEVEELFSATIQSIEVELKQLRAYQHSLSIYLETDHQHNALVDYIYTSHSSYVTLTTKYESQYKDDLKKLEEALDHPQFDTDLTSLYEQNRKDLQRITTDYNSTKCAAFPKRDLDLVRTRDAQAVSTEDRKLEEAIQTLQQKKAELLTGTTCATMITNALNPEPEKKACREIVNQVASLKQQLVSIKESHQHDAQLAELKDFTSKNKTDFAKSSILKTVNPKTDIEKRLEQFENKLVAINQLKETLLTNISIKLFYLDIDMEIVEQYPRLQFLYQELKQSLTALTRSIDIYTPDSLQTLSFQELEIIQNKLQKHVTDLTQTSILKTTTKKLYDEFLDKIDKIKDAANQIDLPAKVDADTSGIASMGSSNDSFFGIKAPSEDEIDQVPSIQGSPCNDARFSHETSVTPENDNAELKDRLLERYHRYENHLATQEGSEAQFKKIAMNTIALCLKEPFSVHLFTEIFNANKEFLIKPRNDGFLKRLLKGLVGFFIPSLKPSLYRVQGQEFVQDVESILKVRIEKGNSLSSTATTYEVLNTNSKKATPSQQIRISTPTKIPSFTFTAASFGYFGSVPTAATPKPVQPVPTRFNSF